MLTQLTSDDVAASLSTGDPPTYAGAASLAAAVLEATSDAVVGADDRQRIVLLNGAAERMFGYSRDELLGAELSVLLPGRAVESHSRLFQKFLDSGETYRPMGQRAPITAQHRDGRSFLAEATLTRLDVPGTGTVIAAFIRDISERLEAEKGMRDNARRFRETFDQAAMGMAQLGLDGRFLLVNPHLVEMLGYDPEGIAGLSFTDIAHLEDRDGSAELWRQIFGEGRVVAAETRFVRKDGSALWGQLTATLVRDEAGRPEHVFVIIEDITEKQRVADENARFRSMVQYSPAAIIGSTLDHAIVSWNPAAESLYGWRADEVIGTPGAVVVPDDGHAEARALWARVHAGEALNGVETVRQDRNGEHIPVAQTLFPLRNASGAIDGWATFSHDISSRKAAEAEAQSAHNLLQATLDALTSHVAVVDAAGRIVMVNRAWSEFATQNGASPEAVAVGADHLAACDSESRVAIERLLSGAVDRLNLLYACNSPNETRWFTLRGTPLSGVEGACAVLERVDVTELKLMQRELGETAAALTSSISATVLTDQDGRITFANRALLRMWQYEHELEVRGRPFAGLWANTNQAQDMLAALRASGGFIGELPALRTGGEEFEAQVSASLILDDDGQMLGIMGSFVDATERNRIERELRESQRSLATAQRIAHLGHWDWDISTGALAWSDEIYRIFALEPQQFHPTYDAFVQHVHPDDRDLLQDSVDRALLGEPYSIDHRIVGPDGSIRTVHETGEVTFEGNTPVRMIGTCQDVTQARRTQEILAQSEASLRALFEGAQEAIFLMDRDGRILNLNDAARSLLQRTAGIAVERGMRATDVLPPQLSRDFGPRFGRVAEGGAFEVNSQLSTIDGTPCWVEASYSPVQLASGEIAGVALIVRDTTAKKRVEEQLIHSQKMESVGRLAGGVAHDFNNLLTAILGYTHLARSTTGDDDPRADDLQEIASAAERAANLTRQLLMFARQQVGEPQTVDVNTLLEGMHRLLRRLIGEHIEIATQLAVDVWPILVDPSQLEQVIVNLAVNARDAMPKGGRLSLVVENVLLTGEARVPGLEDGEYVCLSVTDTGEGIAPADLPHIFEPFFTTKGVGKGTGLGLATSFGIVQASGGHITVESRPGKRTRFSVFLPRSASVVATGNRPETSRVSLSRGAGTILLVEDEPQVRAIAQRVLTSLGYEVIEAAHGNQALAVLEARQVTPDLLLTDVVMPQLSGWELAERVRARHPGLPVVFMSGYSQDMDRLERDSSAGFVIKPFSAETLSTAVREAIARTAPRA